VFNVLWTIETYVPCLYTGDYTSILLVYFHLSIKSGILTFIKLNSFFLYCFIQFVIITYFTLLLYKVCFLLAELVYTFGILSEIDSCSIRYLVKARKNFSAF